MKYRISVLAAFLGLAVFIGCDRDKPAATGGQQPQAATDAVPAGLVLTAAPDGAKDVVDVKKSAAKDQEVVVKGVVAGAMEPIAANRAVFTLADATLETCEKMPGETCKTPWDACCAAPADIVAKSMTVQVVGPDGKPLKAALTGLGGLAPLKQVTVKGKIRSTEGEGDKRIVTLDATGIHVKG